MSESWQTTARCHQGCGIRPIATYSVMGSAYGGISGVGLAGELDCGHRYSIVASERNMIEIRQNARPAWR